MLLSWDNEVCVVSRH